MFFTGLGTAVPPWRYTQKECWRYLVETEIGIENYRRLASRSQALVRKVLLGENGISARSLSLPSLKEVFALDPDTLHARYVEHAPALAATAALRALDQAQIRPEDLDGLVISTCTGYLCPGLTSYVAQRLGLRSDVIALDLVGQGCGAAVPNLRTAESLLRSGRCGHVLSVCVEICSAAFYFDDDPGVLISACLFGDGAAGAVLSLSPGSALRPVQWKASQSCLSPADRDYLRFEQKHGMLRNILRQQVPALAGKASETLLAEMLARSNLRRQDISAWILHAGGKEILASLRQRLGLSEEQVAWSAGILREFGNISSPCVLFALKSALDAQAPGGTWWLCTFGAGFTCHGAFIEVGKR
jgi:alkylresorcinol/alkylpyrone synthase